jgi:hypothetical protein
MTADLEAEFAAAQRALKNEHLRVLERLGVSRKTLAEFNRYCGFGVVRAAEHPSEPGLYILDAEGAPHLVLPVWEDGALVDLVGFRPGSANRWLLRTGLGWCLGVERGLERHTWGDRVSLAVSPLDWLRGNTEGLCILDWDAPEVHYLKGVPHLICSNEHQAAMLRSALTRPVYLPTISIKETRLAA